MNDSDEWMRGYGFLVSEGKMNVERWAVDDEG